MLKLKSTLKALANPQYWMQALTVIGGFKAAQIAGAYLQPMLPLPKVVGAFVGPAVVILGGKAIGGTSGTNLALGGMVAAGDVALNLVGLDGIGA